MVWDGKIPAKKGKLAKKQQACCHKNHVKNGLQKADLFISLPRFGA